MWLLASLVLSVFSLHSWYCSDICTMPWRWCLWLSFAAAMRIVQEDAFPSNCTLHAAVSRIIANKQLRQLQAAPFCQV